MGGCSPLRMWEGSSSTKAGVTRAVHVACLLLFECIALSRSQWTLMSLLCCGKLVMAQGGLIPVGLNERRLAPRRYARAMQLTGQSGSPYSVP